MKMNKCTATLLSILILVSNIGMAFNIHYCGGEVASIKLKTVFSSTISEKKCCGDIEMDTNCCKNKVLHFQKKSDDSVLKSFAFNVDFNIVIKNCQSIVFKSIQSFDKPQITSYYCNPHAPPLYKLHHQFIYYA